MIAATHQAERPRPAPQRLWGVGNGRAGAGQELGEEAHPAPGTDAGRLKLDRNNPDATLKRQPILGLQILSELKLSADRSDQWEGNVYNPEDGHTYSVYLRPNDSSMEVEGCLAFFCRTQVWPRVPQDQQQSQQQQN